MEGEGKDEKGKREGKRETRKNEKMERKTSEIVKEEEENLKMKGERYENEQGTFLFSFIYFFACHFLKPLKFVWGVPKWKFLPGKRHFTPGANRKIFLLRHSL